MVESALHHVHNVSFGASSILTMINDQINLPQAATSGVTVFPSAALAPQLTSTLRFLIATPIVGH